MGTPTTILGLYPSSYDIDVHCSTLHHVVVHDHTFASMLGSRDPRDDELE